MKILKQALILFAFVTIPFSAVAQELNFEKLLDSVVQIRTLQNGNAGPGGLPGGGQGSGFYVTPDIIATAEHVVGKSDFFTIVSRKYPGKKFKGRVIARDSRTDLLLIKVNFKGDPLPLNVDPIRINQVVYALGHPYGVVWSVTKGIISSPWRMRAIGGMTSSVVQTDASINPGNSGGPVINDKGEVLGVASFIFTPGGGSIGINFAVSTVHLKRILDSVVEYGSFKRYILGVAFKFDNDHMQVVEVKNEKMKKFLQEGDYIMEINNVPILTDVDLSRELIAKSPTTPLRLRVQRGQEQILVYVPDDALIKQEE